MVDSSLRTMMIDSVPIFEQEVVALAAHPIDVTGDDPLARDDVLEVSGENLIVAIESLIQAVTAARARGELGDHRGAVRGGIMLPGESRTRCS